VIKRRLPLLVCDLDGTLLDSQSRVSRENQEALEAFVGEGGLFTVATGRFRKAVELYRRQLPINAPAILVNGAVIYDFKSELTLWENSLPIGSRQFIQDCMDAFPEMGVEIYQGDESFLIRPSAETQAHILREKFEPVSAALDAVPLPWQKVLFAWEPASLRAVDAWLKVRAMPFRYTFSEPQFLEILDVAASKGSCLLRLVDLLGLSLDGVVAVGDNLNDLEMIQIAGVGVAVANAHTELKRIADRVTIHHDSHAVAEVIRGLL